MTDAVNLIQTLGFPIAVSVSLGYFIYKLINRDKDEAKAREERMANALRESSQAIHESTKTNAALAATNELLAKDIKASLDQILVKVGGDKQ